MASIGFGQERPDGYKEAPLLTLGVTTDDKEKMLVNYPDGWTAKEVPIPCLNLVKQCRGFNNKSFLHIFIKIFNYFS